MLTYHQDSKYILKSLLSSEHNQTGQIHALFQLPLCQQKIKPLSMQQTILPNSKGAKLLGDYFYLQLPFWVES